ncbi:moronecidin-like [Echeneis naucrates]|uniref:moronecidin-like n=1 Tax=Echeneis naucrates TaxID=173247 RepID=UPI0011142103|nr:moronecidin-like [Echeneis naucrates]
MKLTVLFLVVSMVVLMAEPSEGFFHHIIHGAVHVGKMIHRLIHGSQTEDQQQQQQQQEQLDRRSYDQNRFFNRERV